MVWHRAIEDAERQKAEDEARRQREEEERLRKEEEERLRREEEERIHAEQVYKIVSSLSPCFAFSAHFLLILCENFASACSSWGANFELYILFK